MKQRHRVAEPAPKAIHRLRSQRDLGDEDDRAPSPRQRLSRGLQVDLRLAGPGDAVEKEGGGGIGGDLAGQRSDHPLQHGALVAGELDALANRADPWGAMVPSALHLTRLDQAPSLEPSQRRPVGARARRQPSGKLGAGHESAQHRLLAEAEPLPAVSRRDALRRRLDLQLHQRPDTARLRPRADAGRQNEAEATARSRAVLLTDPAPEFDQLGRDPGLERLQRLGEATIRQVAPIGQADDDSDDLAPAEWHHQHRADLDVLHGRRESVVEWPGDAPGGEQRFNLCDRHRFTLGTIADAGY